MHCRAIVFDLDGTLVDSLKDIRIAANRVLSSLSCPTYSEDEFRFLVGDGVRVLFERALQPLQIDALKLPELLGQCVSEFDIHYAQQWQNNTCLYDGVERLLDMLCSRGWKLGILSNKPHGFTNAIYDQLLSRWEFHCVLGQRVGVPRKPDPAGIIEIAERFDCDAKHIYFVGDTKVDMHTARAANTVACGVTWGFRDRVELVESGAQHLFESPLELQEFLTAI